MWGRKEKHFRKNTSGHYIIIFKCCVLFRVWKLPFHLKTRFSLHFFKQIIIKGMGCLMLIVNVWTCDTNKETIVTLCYQVIIEEPRAIFIKLRSCHNIQKKLQKMKIFCHNAIICSILTFKDCYLMLLGVERTLERVQTNWVFVFVWICVCVFVFVCVCVYVCICWYVSNVYVYVYGYV